MTRIINSIVQVAARSLVLVFTGLAFLSALMIALTQVDAVRAWALELALEELNKGLLGRVEVGSITGNLITGFSLHDVRVVADGTTLLYATSVDLRYQFRPLVKQNTVNAEVIIHQPVINLIRNARGVWNFSRIVKPGPPDTTKRPFLYTINLQGLEIIDARLSMHDLTQPAARDSSKLVDFARLDLDRLNLSARARIASDAQELVLQHLGFSIPRADIRVVELSGRFSVDSSGVQAHGLRLETDRTLLDLDARMDSVNFLASTIRGPEDWRRAPVRVMLDAERISTLELKRFIPELSFLDGSPRIRLDAQGTYGDIRIAELNLGLTHSRIKLSGHMRNLDRPDSLFLDVRIANSSVSYADVPLYVPGLGIPNLAYLGTVDLRLAQFLGYPLSFNAAIDATTKVGSARGAMALDLRGRQPAYSADIAVVHANLAPIVSDPSLESDINGHVLARGSGFSTESLNASFKVIATSSTLAGRSVRSLMAQGSYRNNGMIQLDTLLAAWGPKAEIGHETMLSRAPKDVQAFQRENVALLVATRLRPTAAEAAMFADNPSLVFGGQLDLRDASRPRYDGNLRAHRFALSDVLPDASTARLTFDLNARGSSFELDELEVEAGLDMREAVLPDGRVLAPFKATLSLAREGADRSLRLRSEIADIDLAGEWNFQTVINGVVRGLDGIVDYVGRKTKYREEDPFAMGDAPFGDRMNATYSLVVKDLAPLEIFMQGARIAADGELKGEVSGTSQLFSITAYGGLRRMSYQQDSTQLRLTAAQIQVEMRNIAPGRIDDITSINASIRSDSTAQYNDVVFNAPRFSTSLENGVFRINGATGINGTISLAANGGIFTDDAAGYRVELDTVRVGLATGIRWRNEGTVRALVRDNGVTVDSLVMRRNNAELVELRGTLNGDSLRDVELHVSQGALQDFAAFTEGSESYEEMRKVSGWLRDLRLRMKGTLADPRIDGVAAIDSLSYAGSSVGNVMITLGYADRNVTANLDVGGVAFPSGTTSEVRAQIERLRNDVNRRVARVNTMLATTPGLPTIDAAEPRDQIEQLGRLDAAMRRLGEPSRADTTLRMLSAELANLVNAARQLRALALAESTRELVNGSKLTAQIAVNKFPMDLALASREQRLLDGGPVDIQARTDSLPIGFLAPLFSGVQIRGGTADMRFSVTGNWPRLIYSGEGELREARALVEGNNMFYYANGRIRFKDQVLRLEEMTIRNDPRDLPNGRASLDGTIRFDGFQIKDLRFLIRSDQFQVLSDATEAVNETIYGPLVIATGTRPLQFTGTLDRPMLTGDIDVLRGQLRMDQGQGSSIADNNPANYVDLAEWRRRTDSDNVYGPELPPDFDATDTLKETPRGDIQNTGSLEDNFQRVQQRIGRVKVTRGTADQSLADILQIDLEVGIRGQLYLTVNFSPIEQLRAVLATDIQKIKVKRGADGKLVLRESMQLRPGSKYNFIKAFDATGDITFAGDVNKTKLAIAAEHSGRRLRAGNSGLEDYLVLVTIGGTLEKPDINLTYSVDKQPTPTADQDARNRNAISLLLFGRTADELLASEVTTQVADLSSSFLGSGTSTIASRLLTDLLAGGTDFIRSIDLDFSGRAANARLSVVSQFGDVIVRAGGQITDPLNNGTLVVELPLSSLLDIDFLRDVSMQMEASRQSSENGSNTLSNDPNQGIRFGFGWHPRW